MHLGVFSALLLGATALPLSAPAAPPGVDSVTVGAVRFFRAEHHQTRVKAFVQVPYDLFVPAGPGTGMMTYSVAIAIADSSGTTLRQENWRREVPGNLKNTGAYGLEILDFLVAPGRYRIAVTITDSVSGRDFAAATEVQGYRGSPAVSDLLLSPEMREVGAADSLPEPGKIQIGNTVVTAAAEALITPLRSNIHYLFEAYSAGDTRGKMALAIVNGDGRVIHRTRATDIDIPAGGAVFKGQMDLSGLPEGTYDLRLSVTVGDSSVDRLRSFRMQSMKDALIVDSIRIANDPSDVGYFGKMNEAQLDSAKAPLIYLATGEDNLEMFDRLSIQAKRNFLVRFWQSRDPTPGTQRNEAREQFYGAIAYANRTFGESDRGVPGWRTDRGRIYAKYGAPDDVLDRPRDGRAPPYQVWQFHRGRYRYYIFADRTGFGAYSLMYSNDLQEASRPDWQDIVTIDAVFDIQDYLGVQLIRGRTAN